MSQKPQEKQHRGDTLVLLQSKNGNPDQTCQNITSWTASWPTWTSEILKALSKNSAHVEDTKPLNIYIATEYVILQHLWHKFVLQNGSIKSSQLMASLSLLHKDVPAFTDLPFVLQLTEQPVVLIKSDQ